MRRWLRLRWIVGLRLRWIVGFRLLSAAVDCGVEPLVYRETLCIVGCCETLCIVGLNLLCIVRPLPAVYCGLSAAVRPRGVEAAVRPRGLWGLRHWGDFERRR